MTSKHPKRCETCDNWKGHYDVPFCKFWDDKIPITKYGMDLIAHVGCMSHSSASEPVPNPCEESGCTDIENCDEICEHMRIYSPAYVRESRQKARAEVLDEALAEFQNINAPPVRVTYIRHVLESLRQQEGKP